MTAHRAEGSASSLPRRAAFVVGLKRSGTSLLRSLLDGHPEVWVLPRESKSFAWRGAAEPAQALLAVTKYTECFPDGTPERARFESELRARLPGPVEVPAAIRAVAEAVAAVRPPPESARLWIEKTPDHLLDVPRLLTAFGPSTRIVCTLRDPRGQIASRVRRRGPDRAHPVPRLCEKWALADRLVARLQAEHPSFLLVRYEDLVLDTRVTLARVAEHLGIAWHDGLLTPMREGEDWAGNSSYEGRPRGVSRASLERYRSQLTAAQIETIERLLGPRMRARGYATGSAPRAGDGLRRWWMEQRARRGLLRVGLSA